MFKERINFSKIINHASKKGGFNMSVLNGLVSFENIKHPADGITLGKALKLYNEKKYKLAIVEFLKIEKRFNESSYVNFKIGMCYFKQSEWSKALTYFERSKSNVGYKQSWDIQYHATLKHLNKSTTNLATAKNKYNKNKADAFKYAQELFKNKSYWVAIHTLNDYIEKYETTEAVDFLLSNCYEKLTDYDSALNILVKLVEANPTNTNYLYRYAYNLECSGQSEKADEYYQKFLLLKISDQDIFDHGVGVIHAKRGLWDSALAAYREQQKLLDDSSPASLYEKMAYAFGRLYLWEEAAKEYKNTILSSNYAVADLYFKCGEAYEKANILQEAIYFYKQAIKRSNDFKEYWYYRLGTVLEKQGQFKEATKYFEQSRKYQTAFALNPNDVLKTKEQKMLSIYTEYYENLDIIDNTILFESFFGDTVSCNPYALLCNFLKDSKFKNYTFIVILNNVENIPLGLKDPRIIFIKRQSDGYLRYLASAKYLINNVSFPFYFIRKEGQYYLNTWHGTPLKTLGKDIRNPFMDYANVARNFLQATHIISQNRYTNDILLEKYNIKDLYSGKIADTGYPRVDLTLNLSLERKQEILHLLGLTSSKPVVVYAPTWRGTSERKDFDTARLVRDLHHLKSDKYQLVFKCHHLAEAVVKKAKLNIALVPHYIDTNELLGCADVLISDYSSIVFDFLHCNKPIISYAYDFNEYVEERGMYFEKKELLGTVCSDIKELRKAVIAALTTKVCYKNDTQTYAPQDDGIASDKVKRFFLEQDHTYIYNYEKKPVNLMFTGPYIPNGISRSFANLMNNLQEQKSFKLSVIINRQDINAHKNRLEEFNRTYIDEVAYHARVGAMPMTVEEAWVRSKFEEVYKFYSKQFEEIYVRVFAREARRLFGDTKFNSVVNFEGYSLYWISLLSQMNSKNKVVFQHNDLHSEWKTKYPYLEGVFNLYPYYRKVVSVSELTMLNNIENLSSIFNIEKKKFDFANNTIIPETIISLSQVNDEINPLFAEYTGKKILNIGRLSHEKDQEKLIRAFAKSELVEQDVNLFILGQGPLKDHLQKVIQDLNLSERVYLLGQVENPYIYLKNADLFVLSSNHEGQPMVLLEALTLNTPILATDIVGNRSVLTSMPDCLVENTEDALATALTLHLDNRVINTFDAQQYNTDAIQKVLKILHT